MDTDAIVSLTIILLLGLFIYGPWQSICTDYARQIIFEKRDSVFDLVESHDWSYDNREYRTIRSGLEILIRFAHDLTLPNLIFLWLFVPFNPREKLQLLRAIDRIQDAKLKAEVTRLVAEALMSASLMVILKSPITTILAVMSIPAIALSFGVRQFVRSQLERSKIVIQFEAERVGALEDATAAA